MEYWQSQDSLYPMPLVSVGPPSQPTQLKVPSGSFGGEVLIPEPFLIRAGQVSRNWPQSTLHIQKVARRALPHPLSLRHQASSLRKHSPVLLSPPSPFFFLRWEVGPALREPLLGPTGPHTCSYPPVLPGVPQGSPHPLACAHPTSYSTGLWGLSILPGEGAVGAFITTIKTMS